MEIINQLSFYIFHIFTICPHKYSCGRKIAKVGRNQTVCLPKEMKFKIIRCKTCIVCTDLDRNDSFSFKKFATFYLSQTPDNIKRVTMSLLFLPHPGKNIDLH